jgi:glycosyltransferase involved in cell wall biosynthesis
VAFEERALRYMVRRALTFANGAALRDKHAAQGARVIETKTTTLSLDDLATRPDSCQSPSVRLLTVSRIDPRKGLRVLAPVVASLVARGHDVTLDIVGAPIGQIGEEEGSAMAAEASRLGVADRLRLLGPIPLDRLLPLYRDYDVFVLPTRPGEGIPRVLLEAMAAGLPVVTTDVAGISSLVTNGVNGRLVGPGDAEIAAAVDTIITDPALRRRLIAGGYDKARALTLEAQARSTMEIVRRELGVPLRKETAVA